MTVEMTVEIVRAQNFAKLKFPWEIIFRMTRVVKVSAGITAGLALPYDNVQTNTSMLVRPRVCVWKGVTCDMPQKLIRP